MSISSVFLHFLIHLLIQLLSTKSDPFPWFLSPTVDDISPPAEPIVNILGGVYTKNVTLYLRNSPYRVSSDLTVESGATLTIENGVHLFFDTGVGLIVRGSIYAVGNEFSRIQMLPYQQIMDYDDSFPLLRLIDGPTVRQGRLQVLFRERWRSVCTKLTNWTSIDTSTACKSMGYSDGGFWKWYRRNNDTYPFVMPQPGCLSTSTSLWECAAFSKPDSISLSENLCQGEDDIGIYCWGRPSFKGNARHWKGLHILNSPYHYVPLDPDMVSVQKESNSRLEFLDILYAGYDGATKNTTAALWIEGVPPIMNRLRVEYSARDGIHIYEPIGGVILTNSTIFRNRGRGIAVENSTDGRVFINRTLVSENYGDGVWYQQKGGDHRFFSMLKKGSQNQLLSSDDEEVRLNMCETHSIPKNLYFPHLIGAFLNEGVSLFNSGGSQCWTVIALPSRLPYVYTLQFIAIIASNRSSDNFKTEIIVCDANENHDQCEIERFRIPIVHETLPQSISLRSIGRPIYLSLNHNSSDPKNRLSSDIRVLLRVHASVSEKAFYGLNITNTVITKNTGCGIFAGNIRDRTVISNVTVMGNEGLAGLLVKDGAADIWINATEIVENWGDGINISYAGGSITVNGTMISRNRWRGCAFHQNSSSPFLPLRQEIIFKGRPSNNIFYLPTIVMDNKWGGVLVGNFCIPNDRGIQPKILISWTEFIGNMYHPALEIHSCQMSNVAQVTLDFTGNRIEGGTGVGLRIQPAINMNAVISSNHFLSIHNTAVLIRNADYPQLANLPAQITISKNSFKFNSGQSIVSIGLNEDGIGQKIVFNQQNEIRENTVINPYPHLNPRSTPYAALVVSSSNVVIRRNCFKNPKAAFEIGTELSEHSKWIDARENNWGHAMPDYFMLRIFDQFYRYSLAAIEVDPYAAVCNQRNPRISSLQQYYRLFRKDSEPFVLGGTIWENQDLGAGHYIVKDDLHIVPGAKLTIASGAVLQFNNGVGMLVQGEMVRADFHGSNESIVFTNHEVPLPSPSTLRIVNDEKTDDDMAVEGRLEVFIDNQWGTICNRSWTPQLAMMACNQLGLIMDPEYFENWRTFPPAGDLPMLMDNIRCEEREYDLTECRHDGTSHNIASSCAPTEVVGLRCSKPRWAGVRYSLLANPPTVTGQITMNNWVIEKGGLFDFRRPQFCAALQIDWNTHTFQHLVVRNNFWNGIDIVYNDLTKKPIVRMSTFVNNRRDAFHIRSTGITVEKVNIKNNGRSGVRYNPRISPDLQRDIVSWLERREQPEMEANNVFIIPNKALTHLTVRESQLNQRKFLIAKPTDDCPLRLSEQCIYELRIEASGYEFGLSSRVVVQVVNRAGRFSDEDIVLYDEFAGKYWSVRKNLTEFPVVSSSNTLKMSYRRTYGKPKLVILVLFLDAEEYLDRFIHFYKSVISDNQYAVMSSHYSSDLDTDGMTVFNRMSGEKLWFQKVNFTRNREAILTTFSPAQHFANKTAIATITYHIDNCSITNNSGSLIASHRDRYRSANVFHWNFWSNTFEANNNCAISVELPNAYDMHNTERHSFLMTENRFKNNRNFSISVRGYYAFINISSNNFTENIAPDSLGLLSLSGMEKRLFLERNRIFSNTGSWMIKVDIHSQFMVSTAIPAYIQYNYITGNRFIKSIDEYVEVWPRSYAIGVFGAQKVDIHFNRLRNILLDFELISGCSSPNVMNAMNVTHNWWGTGNEAEISQRIFDFDDWNIYTLAHFSPFYVTEELFISFWWTPSNGQLADAEYTEPSEFDLKGRMFRSKNLTLTREKWHQFPFHYRPARPYRIIKDLTIMPGATLFIERGVEVHVWPNVRILVLGSLVADGTFWLPVRFKPLNMTEFAELNRMHSNHEGKSSNGPVKRDLSDPIYEKFPTLHRYDPLYQKFDVRLNGVKKEAGFLEVYNATTGEYVPSCDREFTVWNAKVVCRQLGLPFMNVYHWLTPRWEYNPKIRILKTYMEPRQCRGDENSLEMCQLRIHTNLTMWQCVDNEHFNYIHCGNDRRVNSDYLGSWGGIVFARDELDASILTQPEGNSVLRHVEVVGAGYAHNETVDVSAILVVQHSIHIENLNVTNSSMHGLQIINSPETSLLHRLNVSDNNGRAVSVSYFSLQAISDSFPRFGTLSIPYHLNGVVHMCTSEKNFSIKGRMIVLYKYDSVNVDCIKIFSSSERQLTFRFLQVNLYNAASEEYGRGDFVSIYGDRSFEMFLRRFTADSDDLNSPVSATDTIAIHMRASAADGIYGFIAEVTALPSKLWHKSTDEVRLRLSRIERNDRGGILHQNLGDVGPNIIVESCSVLSNGYHLFGNITTSDYAVQMDIYNTIMGFYGNTLNNNRGGLRVNSYSSTGINRNSIHIKNNVFNRIFNHSALVLSGNGYQKSIVLNNIFSHNHALYDDTLTVNGVSANLTNNLFTMNVGIHTAHLGGFSLKSLDSQIAYKNWFISNVALGHGHQYSEDYGFQPENPVVDHARRPRRQTSIQEIVSFDWWTHIGSDTTRHRSTVYAGTSQQLYRYNIFDNPKNPFELTTAKFSRLDAGTVDARYNYWGYPGTTGVASGKIRDQSDYSYLTKVDFEPVLESNASLIDGDCPAGWFQIGYEEFKSCYLFVEGVATYADALKFCTEFDSFIPYLKADDKRQKELADKIDQISRLHSSSIDNLHPFPEVPDVHIWISGVSIPSTQCGWMSSRTNGMGVQNCNNLLQFVCEKGLNPYFEPPLWQGSIITTAIILGSLCAVIVVLTICWCLKSRKRSEEEINRREFIRASVRLSKMEKERQRRQRRSDQIAAYDSTALDRTDDPVSRAHRDMIHGLSGCESPASTEQTHCSSMNALFCGETKGRSPTKSYMSVTSVCDDANTATSWDYSEATNDLRSFDVSSKSSTARCPSTAMITKLTTFGVSSSSATHEHSDITTMSTPSEDITECSLCHSEANDRESTLTEDSQWSDSVRSSTLSEGTIVGMPLDCKRCNDASPYSQNIPPRPYFQIPENPPDSRTRSSPSSGFDPYVQSTSNNMKRTIFSGTEATTSFGDDSLNRAPPNFIAPSFYRTLTTDSNQVPINHTEATDRLWNADSTLLTDVPNRLHQRHGQNSFNDISSKYSPSKTHQNTPFRLQCDVSPNRYSVKRPLVEPPRPPDQSNSLSLNPSRSLTDLVAPGYPSVRRNSLGRVTLIETSM